MKPDRRQAEVLAKQPQHHEAVSTLIACPTYLGPAAKRSISIGIEPAKVAENAY
jgi:hypothetical protein